MKQLYKFIPKFFFSGITGLFILFTLTWKTTTYASPVKEFYSPLTMTADTTKPLPVTTATIDPTKSVSDTTKKPIIDTASLTPKTDTFSIKISKDSLEAPLKYQAQDSAVILIQDKKVILYGKTKTNYQDIELTAPKVEVDQQTQVVTAVNAKDSSGAIVETAHFKSKDSEFTMDTIRYNFKTQIGITKNTYTQQGEFLVIGDVAKKVNENTTFIKRARFTTCLLDDPHFDFVTPKMKVINQKLAVSGPAHLEFEGVPIPIYVPFGIYPLSQGRHSGLMPPQFTSNEQFGLGLEGLGYYKVLSDYWDVKLYGNIYSYGGWTVNINPTYRKRYKYNGAFKFSIQNTKFNFKGDPDYSKKRTFSINWNHTVDSKARPGTNFTASVNAGSTKFNQLTPNNVQLNFQNQMGSSISFSKTWIGKPYNLTISANHNQNNLTRLINVNLPDVGFSVSTQYPFQSKNQVGTPKWYQKLGIGYNGNFKNQVSFYDSAFSFKQLIDTLQWGAQHNIPISLALPPIFNGAVIVSPAITYSQVWIAQKFRRKWNTAAQKVDTTIQKGFFIDQQATFAINLNTAIFGTYQFKHSRIVAIRHVIRPSISFNYKPDLSKQHFYTDTVAAGFTQRFSEFEGSLYGGYAEGRTGGISFQIDNNLEMKWRSKKDTGINAIKKIKLIDGFGVSSGYNFLRDSLKLDLFSFYLRASLFNKIQINAQTVLDPYQTDQNGRDINKYAWEGSGKFKFGRLTYGSVSISTSFQSKPKDPKKEELRQKEVQERLNDPSLIGDQRRLLDYMQQNPADFVDFNIPWKLSLAYSLSFTNRLQPDLIHFKKEYNSGMTFNGSFNLTPKWNFSTSGVYDFDSQKLQTFQMSVNRDMHCWQLSISVVPVGLYRSFSFTISPKASVLQDLRINRSRYFSNF